MGIRSNKLQRILFNLGIQLNLNLGMGNLSLSNKLHRWTLKLVECSFRNPTVMKERGF